MPHTGVNANGSFTNVRQPVGSQHCFTSPKNYYGDPIFTTGPDNVLSFTRICPGGKAGA